MSFTMYAGDSKRIAVTITDEQGAALDISGAVFRWCLVTGSAVIEKDSQSVGGVTITDAQQGAVMITLEPADTQAAIGKAPHELEMTDVNGNVSTVLRDMITFTAGLS